MMLFGAEIIALLDDLSGQCPVGPVDGMTIKVCS